MNRVLYQGRVADLPRFLQLSFFFVFFFVFFFFGFFSGFFRVFFRVFFSFFLTFFLFSFDISKNNNYECVTLNVYTHISRVGVFLVTCRVFLFVEVSKVRFCRVSKVRLCRVLWILGTGRYSYGYVLQSLQKFRVRVRMSHITHTSSGYG